MRARVGTAQNWVFCSIRPSRMRRGASAAPEQKGKFCAISAPFPAWRVPPLARRPPAPCGLRRPSRRGRAGVGGGGASASPHRGGRFPPPARLLWSVRVSTDRAAGFPPASPLARRAGPPPPLALPLCHRGSPPIPPYPPLPPRGGRGGKKPATLYIEGYPGTPQKCDTFRHLTTCNFNRTNVSAFHRFSTVRDLSTLHAAPTPETQTKPKEAE